MAGRRYTPDEIEIDPLNWINEMGQEYRLAGIVFQSHEYQRTAMLPDALDAEKFNFFGNWLHKELSIEDWHQILKRSDDPLVFQRDETGTLKGWIRKAQNIISGEVQQKVWVRDGLRCMYCGKPIGEVLLTVDHWMPLELGGSNSPHNYLTVCRSQNKMKGSMHPRDWCEKIGADYEFYVKYLAEKGGIIG